jgi:cytochrome c peroxidase
MTPRALRLSLLVFGLAFVTPACGGDKDAGKKDAGKKGAGKQADAGKKDAGKQADAGDETDPGKPGEPAVAGAWAWNLPAGITPPVVPEDNPMSAEKVALGHQLFMDKRLSVDGTRSCYSCHQNELGNADGRKLALGPGDVILTRNSPTIWNVGLHTTGLYWDGRSATLEKQAIGAWKGGNMAVPEDQLAGKATEIAALPEYEDQFAKVFALKEGDAVTPDHVAKALSAYERTLLCFDTAYDTNTMSEAAQRGWDLFRGKASCTTCHAAGNFVDGLFHDVGLAHDAEGKPIPDADRGRGKISEQAADDFKFRTPTLRNVAKTAPYFHDGRVATLEEAVRYMAGGGNAKAPTLDPNLRNTALSDDEIEDVVAFLEALTCGGTLEVIGDQSVAGIPETAAAPAEPAEPAAPAEPKPG